MQKRLECIYIHVNIKRCFQVNIYASINIILSKFICVMGQKKDYALCSLFPFQMFIPSLKYFNICIVFSAVQCKECKMDSNYIYFWMFPRRKRRTSLSIISPSLSDILENLKENILEDNNSNDAPQDLENHETDKNNRGVLSDYGDIGSNHANHGEVSLSDDNNNNAGLEEPSQENHKKDNGCKIGDTCDMQPGTNPFSQETMPRVNHENSSNDSAEGVLECIGDIGSIHHEATLLTVEIWEKITDYAIDMFSETRKYLCDVNKLFRNIVDRTALPNLYISYNVLPAIPGPVSVRRLIRVSGRASGLIIKIKRILRSLNWCNHWLFLSVIKDRWFEMRKILYRKKNDKSSITD